MPTPIDQELKRLGIGRKIRNLRETKGLTEDEVAIGAGIARPLLTQIESEAVPPMLGTLLNIGKVLGVGLDHFFVESGAVDRVEFVPASRRLRVARSRAGTHTPLSYSYESLAWRLRGKHMEPFMIEFDPEVDEGLSPAVHDGEEFLFTLDGVLLCEVDGQSYELNPGDGLFFYSRLPHRLRAKGPRKAHVLAVLYPFAS